MNRYALFAAIAAASFFAEFAPAQNLVTFVPITPCRVVETRFGSNSPLGPPALVGGATARSFPVAGACGLPPAVSPASAYSLNITVVPHGALNFLTIFPSGTTQPVVSTLNSTSAMVLANAAIVPAGSGGAVSVYVSDTTDLIIDVDGYFAANTSTGTNNTSLGLSALNPANGGQNTAVGFSALSSNSAGNYNTATGSNALQQNQTGASNTAMGQQALTNNTSGSNNTAVGAGALTGSTTTSSNTAVGYNALNASSGNTNVAIGAQAGQFMTGNDNIAVGYQAANNLVSGSNDIYIGNQGVNGENGVVRIGGGGVHTSFFVAGVGGVNIGSGAAVLINNNGQLGTVQSSARYKEDIQAMGDSSDKLMQLQPVSFRYRQPAPDGSKEVQYGLIAEQVANIFPELVVRNKDGQPESVQYHELPALLLNEIQKQHQIIKALEERLAALEAAKAAH